MPELPEVETICRGIAPHISGKTIQHFVLRQPRLRWPIEKRLEHELQGQTIVNVSRRAKYVLLKTSAGTLILHMGMSGSLRILTSKKAANKHEHWDLVMNDGTCMRYHDPRRFGAAVWHEGDINQHRLLRELGPEPLSDDFDGEWLYRHSRGRTTAIKNFIMNSHIVVGVGNIYASEALFTAGIHPARQSKRISAERYARLAVAIKQVLKQAIYQGGTTLRDFQREDGRPGYFAQSLNVYGRRNEPCPTCGTPVASRIIGQRSSFYCPDCQH